MNFLVQKLFFTLTIVMTSLLVLSAQDALYNFSFDNDLDGWTTVGVRSSDPAKTDAAVWRHTADGTASTGAFGPIAPIQSISGGGAVVFDSDGLDNGGDDANCKGGPAPGPQRGELISPSLDFTGSDRVLLVFNQFYRYFADNTTCDLSVIDRNVGTCSFIEVSNDGGTTFSTIPVNLDADPNDATDRDDIQLIDITQEAANQSDVVIKFVWDGDYYYWIVDDIRFFSEVGVDLSVENYTLPNNAEAYVSAVVQDTFDAEILIQNNGDATLTDTMETVVRILDNDLNLIWSDTGHFQFDLEPDSNVIWDFDEDFVPEDLGINAADEAYFAVYQVRIKGDTLGEAVRPSDNLDFDNFQVRDIAIRKVPGGSGFGFNGEAGGGNAEPYDWANFFSIPSALNQNLRVSGITFEAFEASENDPLIGKSVVVYLVELPEDVGTPQGVLLSGEGVGVANFDFGMNLDDMIAAEMVIGIGSFAWNTDNADDPEFTADVFDFITEEGPPSIQPGRKYLAVIRYPSGSETVVQEISRDYQLWQLSSIASFPSINQGGWTVINTGGDNPTPYAQNIGVIGLEIELGTAVDDVPLPENAARVFPNPANERISVELEFEKPTDANVFLADMTGKLLKIKTLPNAISERMTLDVSAYPAGSYIVRIATKEGTRTEHIVVSH
ncbi:MAG: T9SS type A sorting domain-containing protein [Saprospiraceae bacterium]|nr:T9SS type A sorting domain-containing protein [Saprospiraceae bacterium]